MASSSGCAVTKRTVREWEVVFGRTSREQGVHAWRTAHDASSTATAKRPMTSRTVIAALQRLSLGNLDDR